MKTIIMNTKHLKFLTLFLLVFIFGSSAHAEDLRRIASLSGSWKFSIGDDIKWADPAFNDSDWDQITVPGQWENQGYNDYNGYAWYRKSFTIKEIPENTQIYLVLGRIDDVDEVYLNGKKVGKSGKFPPVYVTAYDRERKYIIPAEYLNANTENVISVKVYDSYGEGGIVDGRVGMFIDTENDLLELNLSGKWKFHTGNDRNWKSTVINDEDWKTINVPSAWENEGYEDYDGYAWYRLEFKLPANFDTRDLYLSLGKIDDIDEVYLNGESAGDVYDLRRNYFSRGSGWEYSVPRIYKIKEGLLNKSGTNTIAVKVYDGQGLGGIYEGPVGIMSAANSRRYNSLHHSHSYNSFWDFMYDQIFGDDNLNDD
jgi:sialate O-acetylesterase